MKSKPVQQPDPELEEEDSVEVEATGPGIAAAKKSKILVIAASSVLITVVLYFLFFKGDGAPKEKLEVVEAPRGASVAPSDDGKSPYELNSKEKTAKEEDVDLLAKPAVPDIPVLPQLPEGSLTPELLAPTQNQQLVNPLDPTLQPLQQVPLNNLQQNPLQNQQVPVFVTAPQATAADGIVKKPIDPRYAPIVVFGGGTAGPSIGVGYDKNIVNLAEDPINGLQKNQATVTATYIEDRIHTIAQGKLLTAILETAINTEIPGSVRAIVSRDVYGESGNEVLIPKGSRLYGAYSSEIVRGQGRVQINWSRLIRPDGVDLSISSIASDQFGRAGLPGDVDNKYGSILTNSLLTSVLAVSGVALAQKLLSNNNDTTVTTNPTQGTTTTTGNATNQALYDVTRTIIDTVGQVIGNAIDVNPVIRVPQGTRITIIVNADIKIPSLSRR